MVRVARRARGAFGPVAGGGAAAVPSVAAASPVGAGSDAAAASDGAVGVRVAVAASSVTVRPDAVLLEVEPFIVEPLTDEPVGVLPFDLVAAGEAPFAVVP